MTVTGPTGPLAYTHERQLQFPTSKTRPYFVRSLLCNYISFMRCSVCLLLVPTRSLITLRKRQICLRAIGMGVSRRKEDTFFCTLSQHLGSYGDLQTSPS